MTSPRGEAENPDRIIRTVEWRGVTIEARYDPDWCRLERLHGGGYAHLELHVAAPAGAPLPVTDTGYRSHFLSRGMVEEAGGVEAYVELWLDLEAAQNPRWALTEAQSRQGDLFG